MAANAWKYGFIMSYPKGKTSLTCYMYEPWHYRYVGRDVAAKVQRQQADAARVPVAPAGVAGPGPDAHADPAPTRRPRPRRLAPLERLARGRR